MTREQISQRLVFGLGGWLQMLACQGLHHQAGEDAARVTALQTLNAQNAYRPETSAKPTNWGTTKKRVDIALRGTSSEAQGWYGVFELKWAALECDHHAMRPVIIEDVARAAFVTTTNMRANVLVVGGIQQAMDKLFDGNHRKLEKEQRRNAFRSFLSRDINNPNGVIHNSELLAHFPSFGSRIPEAVFNNFNGRLKTTLLAACYVMLGPEKVGSVYAWQCKRTRGSVQQNP